MPRRAAWCRIFSMKTKINHVIIRSARAGVFAAQLVSLKGQTAQLKDARRLYYWDGAASLSELSQLGVSKPENCKFPCEVPSLTVMEVIEVLPMTTAAVASVAAVKIWSARTAA